MNNNICNLHQSLSKRNRNVRQIPFKEICHDICFQLSIFKCSNCRLTLLVLLFLFFCVNGHGQQSFPVYNNLPLPKPESLSHFDISDFKVDSSRLRLFPDGFLYGERQVLEKLFYFLQYETEGIQLWDNTVIKAIEILSKWDFNEVNFDRYVYRVSQLQDLSLVYMLTGHKELGEFIRGHILQIMELPYEFWVHAELRGFNPSYPKGGLETAALCNTITVVLSAASDLFSATEMIRIKTILKEKGLTPCVNWLSDNKSSVNNWLAVISSATYHTAKYLCEKESEENAVRRLIDYVNGSFEIDGSYGEGFSYFDYPVKSMFLALLAMGPEERSKNMVPSGLKNSASWKAYPLLLSTNGNKRLSLHFGDNVYSSSMDSNLGVIFAYVYRNPVALWLMDWYEASYDLKDMLFVFSEDSSSLPEMKSPEQMGLPLIKSFKGGDSYIRSSWEHDGIVLGMWSSTGALTKYTHQRPELGSISMGAYGEYLIVSSGSASYRSDLHYQWDLATKAANTIVIDDKNQLFPNVASSSWNKTDVSDFWSIGSPRAEVLQCESGEISDLLVCEMAMAYHVPLNSLRRSVLFVKDPGYFVIIDRIEAETDVHKYSWRIHLNNRDNNGKIKRESVNHWLFSRPFANLDIYLFSDKKIDVKEEKGYMHGPSRDYSPGGINEGILGSSIALTACNVQKTKSMMYYSVIFPTRKNVSAPKIHHKKNQLFIVDDIVTLDDGECIVSQNKKTEKYKLWE